jgi:hypothetical protein
MLEIIARKISSGAASRRKAPLIVYRLAAPTVSSHVVSAASNVVESMLEASSFRPKSAVT